MTIEEARALAEKGEGSQLEFKRRIAYPEKVVRECVAFANSSGGLLLVGVNDDGLFTGLKFPEEDLYALNQAIKTLTRPIIKYSFEVIPLSKKKSVIAYTIPESGRKPHYAVEKPFERFGKAYFRISDQSVQASRELRLIMKGERETHKNRLIHYGEPEQQLMQLFHDQETIDINTFLSSSRITRKKASDILINLTLANVLEILPGNGTDKFRMKQEETLSQY